MSKSVLIISTSPRKGGNSDALAEEFARGAREAGNRVEKIELYNKTIGFCKGCLAGTVFGGGADAIGTIQGNPALEEAYQMGKTV